MGYAAGFLREEDHFSEKAVYGRTGRDYPTDPQQPDRKKEEIRLLYEPDVEEKVFEEKLQSAREKDLRFRVTSVISSQRRFLCTDQRNRYSKVWFSGAAAYGSSFFKNVRNLSGGKGDEGSSILLLDDVLSELDSSRQNYLLQSIHNIQTVITCTGLDELIENNFSIDRVFQGDRRKIDFK